MAITLHLLVLDRFFADISFLFFFFSFIRTLVANFALFSIEPMEQNAMTCQVIFEKYKMK